MVAGQVGAVGLEKEAPLQASPLAAQLAPQGVIGYFVLAHGVIGSANVE